MNRAFVILAGSRNPEGQTARAVAAVRLGIESAGGRVETVFLPQRSIERCRQCDDTGWGLCRKEGRCVIRDDFAALVESIRTADGVVFGTPVYYSDLSESLRAFLDRLRRIGTGSNKQATDKKRALGLCVAGGGGGGAPACCLSLEKVLATCGFDVVDMIPVRRQNLAAKLPLLERTGEWLATATSP
jgi:multimeric flavodoxin WrbA